jgi:hypothetical protein
MFVFSRMQLAPHRFNKQASCGFLPRRAHPTRGSPTIPGRGAS